jgi:raffinose/stachyose/melibiose transport system permease protein
MSDSSTVVSSSTPGSTGLTAARYALRIFVIALTTVFTVIPVVWLILSSFKTNSQILSESLGIPSPWNFQGYVDAFQTANLHVYFLNTILVSSVSTALTMGLAILAAYPAARFDFPGNRIVTLTFTLGIFVPLTALTVPVVIVIRALGLYDTKTALVLVYSALFFPITFVVYRGFFLNIPKDLESAAAIDGAGYFTTLGRIVLPISVPAFATVIVLVFIRTWNEFYYALLLTGSVQHRTVQVAIQFFTSAFDFNFPGLFASLTLVMIVPIVLYIIFQEKVVSGLTAGATKY